MICQKIQNAIEHRYDLNIPYQVEHFLSHDEKMVQQLTGVEKTGPEVLLIREEENSLDITLFLDKELVESTKTTHVTSQLDRQFDNYCTILEGVSHFVYLVWNAQFDRQVKPIEMELQAEVDKFVFSALVDDLVDDFGDDSAKAGYPSRQSHHAAHYHNLLVNQFENVRFTHSPGTILYHRYRTANAFAYRYCLWLCSCFQFTSRNPTLYAELARFYRMNAAAKFAHINEAPRVRAQ